MNDKTNGQVDSHMLLQKIEAIVSGAREEALNPVTSTVENPPFVLNEDAEKLRAAFEDHVRKVFMHGISRITAVRIACDMAEETLRNKCERVLESQKGLVYSIQEIDRTTADMQKKLGDLLVATDQI